MVTQLSGRSELDQRGPDSPFVEDGHPNLALLAHPRRERDLRRLLLQRRYELRSMNLVVSERVDPMIRMLGLRSSATCPDNGGGPLLRSIVERTLKGLIFLAEHSPGPELTVDPKGLLIVCDLNGIPTATNLGSARVLIDHLSRTRFPIAING